MKVRTFHRVSLVGAASAPVVGVMAGSTLLLGAGALLLVVFVSASGRLFAPRSRGLRLVVHGVTVAGLLFALSVFSRARFDSILLIVMLGMGNRFLLRTGQRDDVIVLGAASVLMAATTVVTPSLAFLFIFATFVVLVLWALQAAQLAAAGSSPDAHVLERQAPNTRVFLAVTGLSFMAIGSALFSLFPRYNFARFLGAGAFLAFSGASNTMELQRGGFRAQGRGMVVMRIEPADGDRVTVEGLYARMYALDAFDGARFFQGRRGPDLPLYRSGQDALPRPGAVRARVRLLRTESRRTVHPVAALGRSAPFKVELPRAYTRLDGTWLSSFRNSAMSLDYAVSLSEAGPRRPLRGVYHRQALERGVLLPDDLDERIHVLSLQLTAGLTEDEAKINAVVSHFATDYRYSLDPPGGDSKDPLVRFIFEAKAGHCELYAAAVAVLLRAAGIPARVATGYYGGYWNGAGGYLEMSDEDAHAWVEVYDGDRGWRWVDATPESERSGARREKALALIRDLYDRLEALWYEHVIDFDEQQRQRVVGGVTSRLDVDDLGLAIDALSPAKSPAFGPGTNVRLLLGSLVFFGGGTWWWVIRTRRTAQNAGTRLYRLLGGPMDHCLTFGALLARAPESLRRAAGPVVADYQAFRFGVRGRSGRTPIPRDLARRIGQLRRIARASRRSVGLAGSSLDPPVRT